MNRLLLVLSCCTAAAVAASMFLAVSPAAAQVPYPQSPAAESAAESAAEMKPPEVAGRLGNLAEAIKALDVAEKAIQAGQMETALAHVAKARELIRAEAEPKVVNACCPSCPMMGTKLDPCNVPPGLIKTFRGRKVGFCSPACCAAWDTLSEEQKAAKLDAAMPSPETKPATPAETAEPQAKVTNLRCPIMGNKIDPAAVPPSLVREFQGRKVGFCCASCVAAWDKLSDEEKTAKLEQAKGI